MILISYFRKVRRTNAFIPPFDSLSEEEGIGRLAASHSRGLPFMRSARFFWILDPPPPHPDPSHCAIDARDQYCCTFWPNPSPSMRTYLMEAPNHTMVRREPSHVCGKMTCQPNWETRHIDLRRLMLYRGHGFLSCEYWLNSFLSKNISIVKV